MSPSLNEILALLRAHAEQHMGFRPRHLVLTNGKGDEVKLRIPRETPPPAPPPARPPAARHSDDFHSVNWFGAEYAFTNMQAVVVKRLWEAWEDGTPDVGQAALLEAAESDGTRLRAIFRERGAADDERMHPAWNSMIVPGSRRGNYRLAIPANGN